MGSFLFGVPSRKTQKSDLTGPGVMVSFNLRKNLKIGSRLLAAMWRCVACFAGAFLYLLKGAATNLKELRTVRQGTLTSASILCRSRDHDSTLGGINKPSATLCYNRNFE